MSHRVLCVNGERSEWCTDPIAIDKSAISSSFSPTLITVGMRTTLEGMFKMMLSVADMSKRLGNAAVK
jgi:hypothetical protein